MTSSTAPQTHDHHRRNHLLAFVGLLVLLAIVVGVLFGLNRSSKWTAPPETPRVTPAASELLVSWAPPLNSPGAQQSQVRSLPKTTTCAKTGTYSCTLKGVTDATPWTFSVREDIAGKWTKWSAYSAVVPHLDVVIVAGQSNALGWESFAVNPETGRNILQETATPADNVVPLSWDLPGDVEPSPNGLGDPPPVPLLTPQTLTNVFANLGGHIAFGPEINVARGLYALGHHNITILKVAQGGTALGGNGPWNPQTGYLYKDLVDSTHQLLSLEADRGISATIAAINWYQGESDSTQILASQYEANLTQLLGAMRHDLPTNSATPIVLVKNSMSAHISYLENHNGCSPIECEIMREANNEVRAADDDVAAKLPHVSTVDAVGFARAGGMIHLTAEGELELGTVLAKADASHNMT